MKFHHFNTHTNYRTSLERNETVHQSVLFSFMYPSKLFVLPFVFCVRCSECLNKIFLYAEFIHFLFVDNAVFCQYNTGDEEKLNTYISGTT